MAIPDEMTTMAEHLSAEGFATLAVSASPVVRATPSSHNPDGGFGGGFDFFDEACLRRDAFCVNQRALGLLDVVKEPFFLYLHYMDPHGPYKPPPDHDLKFAGSYDGHDFIKAGEIKPIAEMLYADGEPVDFSESDLQHLVDLYDDEILYFDGQFEVLANALRDRGLMDRTLLIIASDHGEEFMEHDHIGHCRGVWDTQTRTPLLLRIPGEPVGQRLSPPVQNVDILPTVLDYVHVGQPRSELEGVSLRGLIEGAPAARGYAHAEQGKYRATDNGRFQLILNGTEKTAELFDLASDPLGQSDRLVAEPDIAQELSLELNRWLKDTGQWIRFDEALASSSEQEERLRALGYLQ